MRCRPLPPWRPSFDAELAGLFVEDVNLQHLFGLPSRANSAC